MGDIIKGLLPSCQKPFHTQLSFRVTQPLDSTFSLSFFQTENLAIYWRRPTSNQIRIGCWYPEGNNYPDITSVNNKMITSYVGGDCCQYPFRWRRTNDNKIYNQEQTHCLREDGETKPVKLKSIDGKTFFIQLRFLFKLVTSNQKVTGIFDIFSTNKVYNNFSVL